MNLQHLLALQSGGGMSLITLAPLLFIFAIFYFLLIMPQQRRQKKWQQMLSELKTGDKVVTSGGLRGIIMTIKDDSLYLRVAPDICVWRSPGRPWCLSVMTSPPSKNVGVESQV